MPPPPRNGPRLGSRGGSAIARTYYPHVEGLRGLAALWVVLFHVWKTGIASPGATLGVLAPFAAPLQYGHYAVALFIVISGYCLGLPVALHPGRPFDARAFAVRRLRRLGPAYVAALFLSVVPFCFTALLDGHRINVPHIALAVALHLALVHNLFYAVTEYLNGPMWSIALECQIYVVFALILVPLWRRFGVWAQAGVALALGLAPHVLLQGRFDWTAPWMLGLFALGVAAAQATARGTHRRAGWGWCTGVATVTALALAVPRGDAAPDGVLWLPDLAVGVAVACFFVWSGGAAVPWPARVIAWRPIALVGAFSYSLYLIHGPLVLLVGAALARAGAGAAASAIAYALLLPALLGLAYAFYRTFERPFMSSSLRAAIDVSTRAHAPARDGPLVVEERTVSRR